ncbi:MAG: hypothetical protein DCF12_14945 [Snowella sp.]|nr:MAG: hypothetical protein DCF12_14945 [Snowella sp.]
MNITETTSLNAILSETGKIYLSVDGYGTLDQTGSVQILKKPDATVRKAYLVGDGTTISSSAIGTTATLNGTTVNWDRIESTSFFYSYLADVTDLLKPTIDSAASGTVSIALDEGSETYSYEGLALAVLFDDPNQTTDNNVILYFGGLPPTGATSIINFSSPVDLSQVGEATLGLGIGFSYAAAGQTSQVSVNGQPLTLVAGNYDDGVGVNGALFTVGGFEDNPDNPSPVSTDPETDDELYNLLPFINNGDSSLTLNTVNPSNDDHIFFAHLTLEGIQTTSIPSIISFSGSTYEVLEDGSAINSVTLTRSGSVIGEASVTLTPTDGTAIAGDDYDGTPIVVNFADGQTRATVTIPIIDNTVYQGDKTINLVLSDPTDGAILGSQITSLLTIVENDPQSQLKYGFTYFYGNGDSYSGYVYAPSGTYSVGQLPDYYDNETGSQQGYYLIDSIKDGENGTNGYVYVTSYTDADTGFGTTTNIYSGLGYYGLGSEQGYAFNANPWTGDYYFSSYYEADLPGVVQVRLNLLADDGGTPGELIANNQIGVNKYFFVEILVADLRGNAVGVNGLGLDLAWDGFILESIDFDPALAINSNFVLLSDGSLDYDGLISNLSGGSLPEFELGQAIGVNQLERFALLRFYTQNSSNGTSYFTTTVSSVALADDASYSLDVEENQPIEILSSYNQYNFTYYYENGDFYKGYVYAQEGTYTEGQQLRGYSNETGNEGYYEIGSIAATTLDSNFNNRVYVTSYTDADTGFGVTTNIGEDVWTADGIHGYSGLGSESGYAYDINGNSSDPLFSKYYEADIYSIPTLSIQPTDAIKAEGNSGLTYFTFTVSRVGSLFYSSSVDWSVMGSGSHSASPDDFASGSYPQGTLDFAPGQDTATIIVEVNGDITSEMDESFSVTLSNPVDAILDTSSVVSNITSSVSGGYGVTTNYYSLAGGGGRFVMDYEMYGIPDQAEIFINGSLAASTSGFVSGSGTLNLDTFALQSGDMVRVVMTGVDFGTAWDYTVQYNGGVQTLNYIADGLILNDDIPSLFITDNSGDGNDSSIKFTTQFPLRKNYAESDFVRPNFADSTKYFDITNTGTGILQVSDIVSNVAGVTTNFGDDLLINPGESQRIQLSYAPSAARQDFSASNGLVLFTNDPYNSQYAIALSGKSTFNSDINYDGKVNTGDLGPLNLARKNYNQGIFDPTADINGDGLFNNADVLMLQSENKQSLFV